MVLSVSYITDRGLQLAHTLIVACVTTLLSVSYITDRGLQRQLRDVDHVSQERFQYPTSRIVDCNPPPWPRSCLPHLPFSILHHGSWIATHIEGDDPGAHPCPFSILHHGSWIATHHRGHGHVCLIYLSVSYITDRGLQLTVEVPRRNGLGVMLSVSYITDRGLQL